MNTLKIYQTSDIHGNIFPTNYVNEQNWGLAKISTLIKERSESANRLIIDSGDLLQGSSLSFFTEQKQITSPSIIDAFNIIGYDAITLGNHEFNYGLNFLKNHYTQFSGDILCANITGLPFATKPYQVYHYGEFKVAVIGLTTSYIPHWELPQNIEGICFLDPVATYAKWESQMKAESDFIIVNYHGGFERDLDTNQTLTEADKGENVASRLAATFTSIDLLLTGHQHRTIATQIENTVCMQPSYNGLQVSEITIDLNNKQISDYQLVNVASYEPDQSILSHFNELNQECNNYLDTTLATLDRDLTIDDPHLARRHAHPFLSLLGTALNSYYPSDIVALSIFDSAVGFTKDVTIRQVNRNYPFPNTLMQVELKGCDVLEAIAQSNNYYTLNEQGEIDINPDYIFPKLKHYNYDMFWGIKYTVKVCQNQNQIYDVFVGEEKLDINKNYTVLVSNYRFNNRDDYPVYAKAKVLAESQDDSLNILINYMQTQKEIIVEDIIDYTITK